MKLIIDIPEEIYKASKIIDVKYEDVVQIPLDAIANGTPLKQIRDEIEKMRGKSDSKWRNEGTYLNIDFVLEVIDKCKGDKR